MSETIGGYFNPLSSQSQTADAFPCPRCGVLIWVGHEHECTWIRVGDVKVGPTAAVHEHTWVVGRIETEGVGYPALWTKVVYLVCQCGATKRSVPE